MAEAKSELLRSFGVLNSKAGGMTKLGISLAGTAPRPAGGVTWTQLQSFLFPSNLEHPESTGRLELFARYGPVDEKGCLHGGRGGTHVHTDGEIRLMIKNETREALFSTINKPRDTADIIVDQLLPVALSHNYTLSEIKRMLKGVPVDGSGRMDFADLQEVILADQERRLKLLVKHGAAAIIKERGPVVPYQSEAAEGLLAITRKKKINQQEEQVARQKRFTTTCTLVSQLEEQNLTPALVANTQLVRGLGSVSDRWDRYCALRRKGKSSYVEARNELRPTDYLLDDDGLKHRGCSNLRSAGLL